MIRIYCLESSSTMRAIVGGVDSSVMVWPEQMDETAKKLDNFLRLEEGWHFGEGSPPSATRVRFAKRLSEIAKGYGFALDVFPGIDGEVRLCVYFERECLEFTIEKDDGITFVHEKTVAGAIEFIQECEGLSSREAEDKIAEYGKRKWLTSGSSTRSIGIRTGDDLKPWRFETAVGEEYRFFPQNVQSKGAEQSVSIFNSITG